MGRGSSKMGASGSGGEKAARAKPFRDMSISEKRNALKAFEANLDDRFTHYSHNGYKIYKIGNGQYAAHKFDGVSDSLLKKATDPTYFAVLYDKTLKAIKSQL